MARSATLNPTSMPFFPGSLRNFEDAGTGFRVPMRDQDGASVSSLSASSVDHRSLKSSPSPPRLQGPIGAPELRPDARFQLSPPHGDRPPFLHQVEPEKQHLFYAREMSKVGSLESLPEADDTPNPNIHGEGMQTPGDSSPFASALVQQSRNRNATPPVNILNTTTLRSSSFNVSGPFPSSSPVSSLDSGSQLASSTDYLEAQLKASPLIHDIIDRLQRCEYNTREIQRDLSDMHRKINILIERTLSNVPSFNNTQPEFKDPFASVSAGNISTPANSFSRASFSANIAPNQASPSDDITQISQRLNTLTTSVGQLLALQTQQHIQNATTGLLPAQLGRSTPQMQDMAPNQAFPHGMGSNTAVLGHGLPNRPDLRPSSRTPNPPMRTWSAGTLDLPMRADTLGPLGRLEPIRDKRRSVTGGTMRRESGGMIDAQASELSGGSGRDNGPMVSKWEQLNLAPDLLHSLSKFGVGPPNKIQQRALPFLLRGADIIAQAPPTQERIAAYVIPAIQVAVVNTAGRPRGPLVIMISTTVDQATQAQRMIRDLGGPIGIRSALGVGTSTSSSDLNQELRLLQQNMPHIICGTPQKLHALFTAPGGLVGSEVRFLVLDEVDQLIARNLHEFVFNIVKLLPPPRSRPIGNGTPNTASAGPHPSCNSFDGNSTSSLPTSDVGRRFSAIPPSPPNDLPTSSSNLIERQTALFSNTVPQDVLNLATAIQLKEPVRVLVRRDGNVTSTESAQGSRGLRQFYLYLAFTAGGRSDTTNSAAPGGGHGIIGSGRGASSAESAQAREWKLDALADIFDDVEVSQAIVHVGGMTALDSVVHKLATRGLEAVPLHGDMNAGTKLAALNKFKSSASASVIMREPVTKILVVNDVQVKTPEVSHVPLIVNYDLPKAVEEYAHRVAPAIASNYARAGVVVNFVTATGGDVEMLRSIECFYKIKCPEVPMSLRDII